jgi:hypothetical protein
MYSHSANAPTVYSGGAGGAGGAAAPAVTGGTGKRGGAGGGGAIFIVTENILPETISYDTRAGILEDIDNHSASSGSVYILINS